MKDRLHLLIKFGSLAVAAALTVIGCILLYTGYTQESNDALANLIVGTALFALAMIALKAGEIIRE